MVHVTWSTFYVETELEKKKEYKETEIKKKIKKNIWNDWEFVFLL